LTSEFHADSLFAIELIGVKEFLVLLDVLMDEPGYFHVEAAVLSDIEQALLAPPFDRIHPIAGFSDPERRLRDIVQPRFDPGHLIDFDKHIECAELMREIKDRITH
jgi:hypothetical protein